MKSNRIIILITLIVIATFLPRLLKAQSDDSKLVNKSSDAKDAFIKSDAGLADLFSSSYGYVIFPSIRKGAFVVGGAGGRGIVYQNGSAVGTAKMAQLNVGAQIGGQQYREVIFFENKDALDRFKDNKFEFSGQASAVAVKSGASVNAKYREGAQVFTQEVGGLMLEASVGGQKFTYKPF